MGNAKSKRSSSAPVRSKRKGLCKRCKSMFSTLEGLQALCSDEGYDFWSYQEIKESSQKGCPFCIEVQRTQEGVSHWPAPDLVPTRVRAECTKVPSTSTRSKVEGYPQDIFSMRYLSISMIDGWDKERNNILTMHKPPNDRSTEFLTCMPITYDMSGDVAMQEARRRLDQCLDQHDDCEARSVPCLPTRVIDVEFSERYKHPRLHISGKSERANYLTLSYCWGGPQRATLTMETIEAKVEGIPLEALPQTIQDAVQVTRKLGFRYLWIDALCIIQDSPTDKAVEISHMTEIYRNATLTIAASNSYGVQDGFVTAKPTKQGCNVPFLLPNGTLGNITIVSMVQVHLYGQYWPLEQRAWALQEFLLSPRQLIFAEGEVRWHCPSERLAPLFPSPISYTEQFILRLPPNVFHNPGFDSTRGTTGNAGRIGMQAQNNSMREEQRKIWQLIMKNYSQRKITVPGDRIPAIAGIVEELERIWNDTYIAGLWESCLLEHLCWYVDYNPAPPPSEYVAPTWSWIGVGRRINVYDLCRLTAEVISYSIEGLTHPQETPPRDDALAKSYVGGHLGPLKSGKLVLSAAVVDGTASVRETVFEDFDPSEDRDGGWWSVANSQTCSYMRIGYIEGFRNEVSPAGLILMPLGDGTFRRIGAFKGLKRKQDMWDGADWMVVTIV